MTTLLIDVFLLFLLVLTALGTVAVRNLLAAIALLAVYSLLMALVWVDLQAVDVAFTEAAVGAGVSTILLIGALIKTKMLEAPTRIIHWPALLVVLTTGAVLVYGTLDMPPLGDATAPAQQHVSPYYIEHALTDTHVPNIVTAVLASYRGYDTMFEVAVIFTAGIGLVLLLRPHSTARSRKKP